METLLFWTWIINVVVGSIGLIASIMISLVLWSRYKAGKQPLTLFAIVIALMPIELGCAMNGISHLIAYYR